MEVTQNLNSNKLSEGIEKNVKNIKENKVIDDEAEISLDESQQALEEKSDNETLEPDEESIEAPIIFEIELMTKNGLKKLEFRQGDDPSEVAVKIAEENGLDEKVKDSIEYKLKKTADQMNS